MRRAVSVGIACALLVSGWACRDSERLLSPFGLFGFALKYVAAALAACAVGFVIGYSIFGRSEPVRERRRLIISTFAAASLLPPLFIFADLHSRWTFVPGVILALIIAALIKRPEWSMTKSLTVSTVLQIGVLLLTVGEKVPSAPFFAIAAGAIAAAMRPHFRPPARVVVSVAILLTAAALMPHLEWAVVPDDHRVEAATRPRPELPDPGENSNAAAFDELHPGVIIWPEIGKHTKLLPPLPALKHVNGSIHSAKQFDIPFNGVYWIFRPPQRQPPANSLVIRDNPVKRILRSTDRRPLIMQARQNFGDYIDFACCRSIDVNVTSADWFTGTVALELRVRDSSTKEEESLGRLPIPAQQSSLSFAVPARGILHRFDEVVLVYHLAGIRSYFAPKISIDRFVFVPR